jgi:CRP-like cAMP-binding protein
MEKFKLTPINHSDRSVADMIDSTSWSNEFSRDEIIKLGAYFTAYKADPGHIIFTEGQEDHYMGLIISGRIRISKTDSNDKSKSLISLRRSQTFGEQSLIDQSPRSGQATATEATIFTATTRRQLFSMSEKEPALAFKLLWHITQILSLRLRSTSYMLVDK